MNCPTRVGNLEASTVARRVQSGNEAAADRVKRLAVEDLMQLVRMTSQKGVDQLVRFRMKLSFSVQVCTG